MKKAIWCLSIILVLVLGVCGFFTIKYFDLKNKDEAVMSISQAKELINKVASDMKFTEGKASTFSNSQTLSLDYKDYTEKEVNYNGKEDFIKMFVLAAKYAFDGDVSEKTYYISNASYTQVGVTYNGSIKFYFTLGRNVLEIHMFDSNINKEIILKLDNNDNPDHEWTMYIYANCTFYGEGFLYAEVTADSNKVTDFAYVEVGISSALDNIQNLTVSNISDMYIYDCDTRSRKTLSSGKSSMTEEEILQYSKMAIEKVNCQSCANFSDLKPYTNSDFLELTYRELGYIN